MSQSIGRVDGLVVRFQIQSANGQSAEVDLDTGFTGQLALDPATLNRLGFEGPVASASVELGDGTRVEVPVYQSQLLWFGTTIDVHALLTSATDGTLGMALLSNKVIHVDMRTCEAYLDESQ